MLIKKRAAHSPLEEMVGPRMRVGGVLREPTLFVPVASGGWYTGTPKTTGVSESSLPCKK